LVAIGCGESTPPDDEPAPSPIDLSRASPLRPRLSGPGRLEIRSPELPGSVLSLGIDAAGTFRILSTELDLRAFTEDLDGLEALGFCPADFGDLGTLDALCVLVEPDASVTVDVTAISDTPGQLTTWSDLDRFDAGCTASSDTTLRCTITPEITLSPLATFTTPNDPVPPAGGCAPVARVAGSVGILEPLGDRLLVGGRTFAGIGQSYPGLVRFGADGVTVASCIPGPGDLDDEVRSVVEDGQGRLYVAGDFDGYLGEPACRNLARVGADGTLDPDFCSAIPEIVGAPQLIVDEPMLYVVSRRQVVAIDLATDTVVATSPTVAGGGPNTPLDIALVDDTLYLAGSVGQIGETTYAGLAALDASTLEPVPVPLAFEFDPHAIEVVGDELWLGGPFTTVDGQPRLRIAIVDEATLALTPTTVDVTGLNARVDDLAVSADGVWIAGRFEQVGGEDREGVALVSGQGVLLDETFELDIVGPKAFDRIAITQVVEDNGVVTILGNFDQVGDVLQHHLASFRRADGVLLDTSGVVTSFDEVARLFPTPSAQWVWAPGGVEFESTESGLVVYDPGTRTAEALDLQADGGVTGAWVEGDVAYLAGLFDTVLGQPRGGFAAVDLASGQLVPWSVDLGRLPSVFGAAFDADRLYVAGDALELDGTTTTFVRVLDKATGEDVPGIAPTLTGYVTDVVPYGDDLILCGDPQTVNGEPRAGLAWISAVDGTLRGTTADLEAPCYDLALTGDRLFVSSVTSASVSGLPADDRLFSVDAATGALDDWQPGFSTGFGSLFGLDTIEGAVLVAGLEFPFPGFPTLVAFD
ncbi:MAG: delta-60 repeat domain-containing protein, partial [Myxococcota bacterium]